MMGVPNLVWIINDCYSQEAGRGGLSWGSKRVSSNGHWQVHYICVQSGPTLCDPMDCSPPGSYVHGIPQSRILRWVAIAYSRGIFQIQRSKL